MHLLLHQQMCPVLLYTRTQEIKHFIIAVLNNLHLLCSSSLLHVTNQCMCVCVCVCVCVYAADSLWQGCLFCRVANGRTPWHWPGGPTRGDYNSLTSDIFRSFWLKGLTTYTLSL